MSSEKPPSQLKLNLTVELHHFMTNVWYRGVEFFFSAGCFFPQSSVFSDPSCLCWEQKAKLEAKLHQTTSAAATASGVGPIHNSVPSNASSAPGFFTHPSDVIPPTPKTTPLFMTPPLTPPNEAVSAAFSAELAHLFPGSMMEPGPVNLAAHKNAQKAKLVSSMQR